MAARLTLWPDAQGVITAGATVETGSRHALSRLAYILLQSLQHGATQVADVTLPPLSL